MLRRFYIYCSMWFILQRCYKHTVINNPSLHHVSYCNVLLCAGVALMVFNLSLLSVLPQCFHSVTALFCSDLIYSAFTAYSMSVTRLIMCVFLCFVLCMVFHRFPSPDRSKAWPGGDSLYIYKNINFTPPTSPWTTPNSQPFSSSTHSVFIEEDGPTFTQWLDLWPLQGLIETTTPTVSRGQPPFMLTVKQKLNCYW